MITSNDIVSLSNNDRDKIEAIVRRAFELDVAEISDIEFHPPILGLDCDIVLGVKIKEMHALRILRELHTPDSPMSAHEQMARKAIAMGLATAVKFSSANIVGCNCAQYVMEFIVSDNHLQLIIDSIYKSANKRKFEPEPEPEIVGYGLPIRNIM